MAASSKRQTMGEPGSLFLTISRPVRSALSQCRFLIRRSFMWAAAKGCIGRIYRSVMAFTNRLTREKPGRIWDCAMDNRWRQNLEPTAAGSSRENCPGQPRSRAEFAEDIARQCQDVGRVEHFSIGRRGRILG